MGPSGSPKARAQRGSVRTVPASRLCWKAISGTVRYRSRRIMFDGEDISGLKPDEIVQRGIVRVPEGCRVLRSSNTSPAGCSGSSNAAHMPTPSSAPSMTVEDDLKVGAHLHRRCVRRTDRAGAHHLPPPRAEIQGRVRPPLGGEQQMLAIERAMMHGPRVLLLDEMSLGLAPITAQDVYSSLHGAFEGLIRAPRRAERPPRAEPMRVRLRPAQTVSVGAKG